MTQEANAFAAMRWIATFWQRDRNQSMASGHARIIANPAYQKLLNAEPWFRRLIPVFIVTFIVLIGLARGAQIWENHEDTLTRAEENLTLIASLLEKGLASGPLETAPDQLTNRLIAALADHAPKGSTRDGRVLLISNHLGKIVAQEPNFGQQNIYLSDILEPTQPLLTFGERAGVMTVTMLETEGKAIVTTRHLGDSIGALTVYQPKEAILKQWRADVSLNASIFIGTGLLLTVVLYAFFTQTARADEADRIDHSTYDRFDTALKHGRCGLWDWDIARGRAFWSPSMYEILGIPPRQALIGYGEIADIIHEDDIDMLEIAERVLKGKLTNVDHTYRMRHSDGHWIWVRVQGEAVVTNTDEPPHLVGICIDVSDQVRLERDNKTANSRLRDSIETLSEAFVLWDAKNRLVVCNEKYRELNQIKPELAVPGAPYAEIMNNANGPQALIMDDDANNTDVKNRSFETALSDGRWLQINEHRTDDGCYVTIGTDITKIKRNQEELRAREQELEASVHDLERSQTELRKLAAQYSRQREIAQNANREKAEFLANISHEWRTPLNAIIGFSDMMKQNAFGPLGSEKYTEYCEDINKSGTYMLAFINDVLDMSEIEAGRFQLDKETFDASDVINDCIDGKMADAEKNDITIDSNIAKGIELNADRRVVKQVIHNLLTNAIKFNQAGGSVSIIAKTQDDNLSVSVTDTGIGIASDLLKEVCKPFKQVQNQFTKNHTGSGLGLAICKSVVEMHQGEMTIKSALGKGTTVTIELPLAVEENKLPEVKAMAI